MDVNVILDVLTNRQPWADDSAAVLSLVAQHQAEGFIAAHSVTTLHYLLRKDLGGMRAAATLTELLDLVKAVNVDHASLLEAFSFATADFEDAVQAVCARRIRADYLVTRDPKPFRSLTISVVSPTELLGSLIDPEEAGGPPC